MKELGKKQGCCINNPTLFFAKHIFCDLIGNQLEPYNYNINSQIIEPEKLAEYAQA